MTKAIFINICMPTHVLTRHIVLDPNSVSNSALIHIYRQQRVYKYIGGCYRTFYNTQQLVHNDGTTFHIGLITKSL